MIVIIGALAPEQIQAEDPAGVRGKGLSVVSPDGWPGGKLESSNALNELKPPEFPVSASYVCSSVEPAASTISGQEKFNW